MNANLKFTIDLINRYLDKVKNKDISKYTKLYSAIKYCILNIELPHDWRLPATRVLAQELNFSRTTVVKAYELLQLENLLISKIGSGYVVNYIDSKKNKETSLLKIDKNKYPKISNLGNSFLDNISLINRKESENVAFRPGLPPLDIFPINQWKNLLNSYWRHVKASTLSYSRSTGIDPLKKNISNYLNVSRNIKCDYKQIIVVSGSLQSLYLIANVLINKGDSVVLENPTFPNIYSVFKSMQANLIPIDVNDEGIDVISINKKRENVKLAVVTPSNNYPLSIKMSLKRRKELLEWASKSRALVIENDFEHEIANSQEKIPAIFSLDNEDRTIYMGTFNRLLHPSIRLGYMIVPKYLIKAVEALQEHSHRFVAPSIQIVMSEFIKRNYLYQHLKNIIEIAQKRRTLFIDEFSRSKTMTIVQHSFCSLHLVANFNKKTTVLEEGILIKKLAKAKITAFSLSKCYVSTNKQTGLIFGYSAARESILKRKVKKIIEIVDKN